MPEPQFTFVGGNGQLPEAIYPQLAKMLIGMTQRTKCESKSRPGLRVVGDAEAMGRRNRLKAGTVKPKPNTRQVGTRGRAADASGEKQPEVERPFG